MCGCLICIAGIHLVTDMKTWRTFDKIVKLEDDKKSQEPEVELNVQPGVNKYTTKYKVDHLGNIVRYKVDRICEIEEQHSTSACADCKNKTQRCCKKSTQYSLGIQFRKHQRNLRKSKLKEQSLQPIRLGLMLKPDLLNPKLNA